MKSLKPYLMRALVDWIVDSECTPYLVIDCNAPGVDVPTEHATDGKLVLNISAAATRGFSIGEQEVEVGCRFAGKPVHINVPIGAVMAVYARENGKGMVFEVETGTESAPGPKAVAPPDGASPADAAAPRDAAGRKAEGPQLKIVK